MQSAYIWAGLKEQVMAVGVVFCALVGGAQLHSFVDKHKLDIFEIEGLKPAKELILV